MDDQVSTFEVLSEDVLKMSIGIGVVLSRILAVQFMADYFTVGGWRRIFWPTLLITIPVGIFRMVTGQEYHIVNH